MDTGKGPILGMGKRGYTKGVLFLIKVVYRKIPKISPGLIFFKGPF